MASTETDDDVCLPLPEILEQIEKHFNIEKELDMNLVKIFFDELKKYQNGQDAIKEYRWLFGLGEESIHMVDSKECRKVYLVNFKTCSKYLQTFLLNAIKLE